MRPSTHQRLVQWGRPCAWLLERRVVRAVLSIAILASLMPLPGLERIELGFFALFFVEFCVRVVAVLGRWIEENDEDTLPSHPRPPGRTGAGMLLVDAVALVSFLPMSTEGARWLRVVRLLRLLALVGYWRRLVGEIAALLWRRDRMRQVALMGVVVGGLAFAGAVVLHHVHGAPFDADEDGDIDAFDASFWTRLWWAFRQIQDPGNMLEAPTALSAVLVSLGLTVGGLLLVSFLIGLGSDVVRELVEHSRMRPPGFRDHTVIVNITPSTQRLLHELVAYYRKVFPSGARALSSRWWADLRSRGLARQRFVVIGEGGDAPEFLGRAEFAHVAYRAGSADEEQLIARTDLAAAKRVLLIADARDADADARTIRTLLTLVERVRAEERLASRYTRKRTRVAIAEVLDDGNVAAARGALATAGDSFRGWVVPTEKLLGLFFAGVVRRPGLGDLLAILLTSIGHELYTCFFDAVGLGVRVQRPPGLGGRAGDVMAALAETGRRTGGARGPVIPIGVLLAARGDEIEMRINPAADEMIDPAQVRGVVGLAADFLSIARWVDEFAATGSAASAPAAAPSVAQVDPVAPKLVRTRRTKTTRLLVCGFRPGTIYLLEELFRSDPAGEVLVVVDDEAARAAATNAIDGHSQLVTLGLIHGRHRAFERVGAVEYDVREPESGVRGRLRIEVADWLASRTMVDLPGRFGHVGRLDAIVFVAGTSDPTRSDARTAAALLKLEELCRLPHPAGPPPSVVVEVFDAALAARLAARARALGQTHVQVFSSQELRAFFLFQSVVVPSFDMLWEELLGAWGQSLVHLDVASGATGRHTFASLAAAQAAAGMILLALELDDGEGGLAICVAPGPDERGGAFDGAALCGAWVVAPDSGGPG